MKKFFIIAMALVITASIGFGVYAVVDATSEPSVEEVAQYYMDYNEEEGTIKVLDFDDEYMNYEIYNENGERTAFGSFDYDYYKGSMTGWDS